MTKLTPTDKKLVEDPKGNTLIVDKNAPVQEVWVNAGGSFDVAPLLINVGLQPFKLPEANRQQLLDEAYRLWKYDPLGGNIIRTTSYFTLGRGLIFEFDDPKAQFYAEKFFSKNRLEVKLRAACDELSAFGEVYMWLRPKKTEVKVGGKTVWRPGDTQVTFIPPQNISNIETAEEDVGDVYNYIFEYSEGDYTQRNRTIPDISKYNYEADADGGGCIVQIKLNSGNLDVFGQSDLIPIKEWLDNYQEFLRDGVVINKLYRSPCFDISIKDGTPDEVSAAISRYRGWSIGSNPVHNDREVWQILEFKGPSSHNEEARRALLLIIAAGVNFAEFMLADGSNSNLATSKTQQLPVIKKFEDRQDLWAHYMMKVFQFALTIKSMYGADSGLTMEMDDEGDPMPFSGRVEFPTISQDKDLEVAQTNKLGIEGGYISPRTAAARLNLNYDRQLEEMERDIDKQAEMMQKKIEMGMMVDPTQPSPDEQLKAETATQQAAERPSRAGEAEIRPRRDRSREAGGSRST